MLSVVCWKWDRGLHPKKRMRFGADHVNILYSMMQRHLHLPFEMVCVTDDSIGIDPAIRIVPLWPDLLDKGGCFVRLKSFEPATAKLLGSRYVSIDLDCVIVDDVTPLFDNLVDFRIWGELFRKTPYCGSLWMMDAGARPQVWSMFDPLRYQPEHDGKHRRGTDQAMISDILFPREATWTSADGIYNFGAQIKRHPELGLLRLERRRLIRTRGFELSNVLAQELERVRGRIHRTELRGVVLSQEEKERQLNDVRTRVRAKVLQRYKKNYAKLNTQLGKLRRYDGNTGGIPSGARIIFFNGAEDPNNSVLQDEYPWIKEHYQ